MTPLQRNIEKYNNEFNLLTRHEQNYLQKYKGPVYITRKEQLQRSILYYKNQVLASGKQYAIVECSFRQVSKNNIFESFKIYYTGISSEEAIHILKFEYPSATDIETFLIIPGKLQKV